MSEEEPHSLSARAGGAGHRASRLRGAVVTARRHKLLLVVFGVVGALLVAELGLRAAGGLMALGQSRRNRAALKADAGYRILALGESTTAAYFVKEEAADWPTQLERLLNERGAGRRFSVFNEGVGGTNTAFIVAALEENLERYRPNMVITMMGANDAELAAWYGDGGREQPALAWRRIRLVKLFQPVATILRSSRSAPPPRRGAAHERCFRTPRADVEQPHLAEVKAGVDAFGEGRVEEGERIFRDAVARHPDSASLYAELGRVRQNAQKREESLVALEKAHSLDPDRCDVLANLGVAYALNQRWRECAETLQKAAESLPAKGERRDQNLPRLMTRLSECQRNSGGAPTVAGARGTPSPEELTRRNHRALHDTLRSRGIRYVAMQYPTRPIEPLRAYFDAGARSILFVDNRKRFEEECAGDRYSVCFSDRFKGTFGHTTAFGHRLIAEAAAKAILGSP